MDSMLSEASSLTDDADWLTSLGIEDSTVEDKTTLLDFFERTESLDIINPICALPDKETPKGIVASVKSEQEACHSKRKQKKTVKKLSLRRRRKLKAKSMPARPLTSYYQFFKFMRPKVMEEASRDGKHVTFTDLARTIARRWQNMNAKGRKKFEALGEEDVARYRREVSEYEQSKGKELNANLEEEAFETSISKSFTEKSPVSSPVPQQRSHPVVTPCAHVSTTRKRNAALDRCVSTKEVSSPPTPTVSTEGSAVQLPKGSSSGRVQLPTLPSLKKHVSADSVAAACDHSRVVDERNESGSSRAYPTQPWHGPQYEYCCFPPEHSYFETQPQRHYHDYQMYGPNEHAYSFSPFPRYGHFQGSVLPPGSKIVFQDSRTVGHQRYEVQYKCYSMNRSQADSFLAQYCSSGNDAFANQLKNVSGVFGKEIPMPRMT